jgi:hypothetical protein
MVEPPPNRHGTCIQAQPAGAGDRSGPGAFHQGATRWCRETVAAREPSIKAQPAGAGRP